LRAHQPVVEVLGGKRIICPVCAGAGANIEPVYLHSAEARRALAQLQAADRPKKPSNKANP